MTTLRLLKKRAPESYQYLKGCKCIGEGQLGRVYQRNQRAVKVTQIGQDFRVATRIVGNNLPGVARVYATWKEGGFYFIEQELLGSKKSLDYKQKKALERCTEVLYQLPSKSRSNFDAMLARVFANMSQQEITPSNLLEIRKAATWLTLGIASLDEYGITHLDLHGHNNVLPTLDFRGYKIIDFGLTRMRK